MDKKKNEPLTKRTKHVDQPVKPDRSRHMSWGNDDVEHHEPKTPAGQQLKSFKKWKSENT